MSEHHEQALRLLHKAEQDTLVVSRLGADPDIAAEILGFHAQQAVEKTMKAVLAELKVTFPHTHRLADLIDLLRVYVGSPREAPRPPILGEMEGRKRLRHPQNWGPGGDLRLLTRLDLLPDAALDEIAAFIAIYV